MSKNKSSRITWSNLIAVFGLSVLGLFVFLGEMLISGGSVGLSIGLALGCVVVLSLLLAAAIKCKKALTDFSKWRVIEVLMIVLFFGAAVFAGRIFIHSFDVMTEKSRLQAMALDDIAAINSMFAEYEQFESEAINVSATGIKSSLYQPIDEDVCSFFMANYINNYEAIDEWVDTQTSKLLGNAHVDGFSYLGFKIAADSIIGGWSAKIHDWDLLSLVSVSEVMQPFADAASERLTLRSESAQLPVIAMAGNDEFVVRETNQTRVTDSPELCFAEALSSPGNPSVLGIVICAIVILLIFQNYIFTERSSKSIVRTEGEIEGATIL